MAEAVREQVTPFLAAVPAGREGEARIAFEAFKRALELELSAPPSAATTASGASIPG